MVGQGGSGCYRNGELQCTERCRSLNGWMEERNRAVDGKRQADREFGEFFRMKEVWTI